MLYMCYNIYIIKNNNGGILNEKIINYHFIIILINLFPEAALSLMLTM